jgi:hypothetical protein
MCAFPVGTSSVPFGRDLDFSRDELLWINNALAEVLGGPEAIAEWEFHTRIGGDREAIMALHQKVNAEIGALRRADPQW